MEVIADKPVGDRRLGRGGFEGGMGLWQRHGRIETGIGDAQDAYLAVVGQVADQPVDAVVGVAVVVYLLGAALVGDEGAHVDVFAFAHVLAAHVLHDENVAVIQQVAIEFQP